MRSARAVRERRDRAAAHLADVRSPSSFSAEPVLVGAESVGDGVQAVKKHLGGADDMLADGGSASDREVSCQQRTVVEVRNALLKTYT